ncbi:GAF domain-containing protein [Mucilaginibacter aquatilis]|uniref:GAF domain-containing protein n=1 Tax=Mucilaginibacter aquatilis TaxID=1517760 RepID=A0A6I4ID76_9SPHI|nr:GAF domain-containing protein [Mucilaginibacter aquatilis]MVN91546.1 GAF domain-containing protein [Mucilaginibacter aquatilis]
MSNEFERLRAVNRFNNLDAGIKTDLNELVELIAGICKVPVALVTLVDDKMQWFKASLGVGDLTCNERELSFCNETISQTDVLVVPDASKDDRFADLPVVKNEPHIKFYAGAPLVTFDGHAVGTLCVLDVKPSKLTDLQIRTLKTLSRQVLNLIELNWSMQSLLEQSLLNQQHNKAFEDSELKLKAIFDSTKDIHILIGRKMEVLAFNKAAYNYIKNKYEKDLRVGAHLLNITNQLLTTQTANQIKEALDGKVVEVEWQINHDSPTSCWLSISFRPVFNNDGIVTGVAINAADITTQKLHAMQIEEQNAALQRIATIQSHELRRPVASLLGLLEVIKLDESYTENVFYRMIETTVHELDNKIKTIVHESESTIKETREIIPETKGSC